MPLRLLQMQQGSGAACGREGGAWRGARPRRQQAQPSGELEQTAAIDGNREWGAGRGGALVCKEEAEAGAAERGAPRLRHAAAPVCWMPPAAGAAPGGSGPPPHPSRILIYRRGLDTYTAPRAGEHAGQTKGATTRRRRACRHKNRRRGRRTRGGALRCCCCFAGHGRVVSHRGARARARAAAAEGAAPLRPAAKRHRFTSRRSQGRPWP
jgi:hypothetical protein